MPRLPTIGGDNGTWGSVLNEFLEIAHDGDGTLKLFINVKDYGAVGNGSTDDTSAIQSAINAAAGAPIYFPAGTYVVTSTLTYTTSSDTTGLIMIGDGMRKTLFDNRVSNGAMLYLDGGGSSLFQYGGLLTNFSIITTTSPSASRGIEIRSVWFTEISRVRVHGLSSDGIRITSQTTDADSPSFIRIFQCELRSNGGWGINCNASSGVISINSIRLEECQISSNTSGGFRFIGISARCTLCSFASNSGPGIHIPYNSGGSVTLSSANCEFDDNTGSHVQIDAGVSFSFDNCLFTHQDTGSGYRPTRGAIIGDGTNTLTHAAFRGTRVRSTPTNPSSATTAFEVKANASYVRIEDTVWAAFSGGNATKYSDAGTSTTIREEGAFIKSRPRLIANTVANGGTYAPSLLDGVVHRLTLSGATATIGVPTGNPVDGDELILILYNNSGGAITVTLNAIYLKAGYTDPASTKRRTARFIYDATSVLWVQVGDWSADL